MSKHCFLRRHPGEGTPMILAIVLVLLMLFCTVAEFSRVWIIAQGCQGGCPTGGHLHHQRQL